MKIAISGGLGFIGSRLANRYAAAGHDVHILDNLHPQVHQDDEALHRVNAYATVRIGDVRNSSDWDALLDGADLVLHMAAETGTGQSMSDVVNYCDVNVTGTAELAEALGRHPSVQRVFLPSSRAIYGEGAHACPQHGRISPVRRSRAAMEGGQFDLTCPLCGKMTSPLPTDEDSPAMPCSVYAATKWSQEDLLRLVCENLGRDLRIARYQNVYGPGQSLTNAYTGVLAIFSSQILAGKVLGIFEDGKIVRDFVFVDDVVKGTMQLLDAPFNPGPVNIGSGEGSTLFDVIDAFKNAFNHDISFEVTRHFRYGDIRCAVADITRARSIGYEPSVALRDGIGALVSWVKGSKVAAP